jgi:hypothetical protein
MADLHIETEAQALEAEAEKMAALAKGQNHDALVEQWLAEYL